MNDVEEQGTKYNIAQGVLRDVYNDVSDMLLPPLGPEFMHLRGAQLSDALVVHRISSKFFEPVDVPEGENLGHVDVQEVILNDNAWKRFSWSECDEATRLDLLRAKRELRLLLQGFKLPSTAVRFPTGESCVTAEGEVSFESKFSLDSQWTCTVGTAKYAAWLCYNTPPLKKLVKERLRTLYPRTSTVVPAEEWNGFPSFYKLFRMVCDVEPARLTTVPKNNTSRRVISMEPTFAMISQLALSDGLRKCMERVWGYRIQNRQELHKSMLAWGDEYVTIDLKNASNSNYTANCRELWPSHIFKHLMKFRTCTYTYKGKDGPNYWAPNMLSPMGNGFTFEVMTATLLSMVRSLDPQGSVYGDDIIIRREFVPRLMKMLCVMGWKVNTTKTFTEGWFRESCGAFYDHSSKEYILSYDFPPIMDDLDAVITCNKLYNILQAGQISNELRAILLKGWARFHSLYDEFRTDPGGDIGCGGVFSPTPTSLQVHNVKTCAFSGMYMRRPRWRRCVVVKKHQSRIEHSPWAVVAGKLRGAQDEPYAKDKRVLDIATIDDHTGLTLQRVRKLWQCELPK